MMNASGWSITRGLFVWREASRNNILSSNVIPSILGIVAVFSMPAQTPPSASPKRTVIAASSLLDGKGKALHDTRIVIEDSRITAIDPKAGPVDYDLRGLTVLPGWIDAHVHITWSFGPDGKNAGQGRSTPRSPPLQTHGSPSWQDSLPSKA